MTKTDEKKTKREKTESGPGVKEINLVDVAVGSTIALAGIAFVALVISQGSESEMVKNIKEEGKSIVKKFFF